MQLNVLVVPAAGGGFVARSGAPFDLSAAAATEADAVAGLRLLLDERVRLRARIISLPLPVAGESVLPENAPWRGIAGMWKDDPTFEDFRREVERYRDEIEADPNR